MSCRLAYGVGIEGGNLLESLQDVGLERIPFLSNAVAVVKHCCVLGIDNSNRHLANYSSPHVVMNATLSELGLVV